LNAIKYSKDELFSEIIFKTRGLDPKERMRCATFGVTKVGKDTESNIKTKTFFLGDLLTNEL